MRTNRTSQESASDRRIRAEVLVRLARDEDLRAADIHVTVDKGVVKLTGMVDDLRKRIAASDAALRAPGVTAVVDEFTEPDQQGVDQ